MSAGPYYFVTVRHEQMGARPTYESAITTEHPITLAAHFADSGIVAARVVVFYARLSKDEEDEYDAHIDAAMRNGGEPTSPYR